MINTERKLVAKKLVLREIEHLEDYLLERDYVGNVYCNNWVDDECIMGCRCKIGDKDCSEYNIKELLYEINKIKGIVEGISIKNNEPKIMFEIEEKEMVDHPSHYNMGKYEAIDVIEDWKLNFNLGNTVKYISRAGHKDDIVQDLKKALWYLEREIKRIENTK
jgi:hypothetical protein